MTTDLAAVMCLLVPVDQLHLNPGQCATLSGLVEKPELRLRAGLYEPAMLVVFYEMLPDQFDRLQTIQCL